MWWEVPCRFEAPVKPIKTTGGRRRSATSVPIVGPARVHGVVAAQVGTRVDVKAATIGVVTDIGTVVPSVETLPSTVPRWSTMVQVISSELSCVGVGEVSVVVFES